MTFVISLVSNNRWEFRTFDHDIRFGIKRVNEKTGEQNIEVEMKRVASHQLDEEGIIACQPDWTCKYSTIPQIPKNIEFISLLFRSSQIM